MPNFNSYDFKRAGINVAQVFLIGYAAVFIVLFSWSAASEYGLEKTLSDLSIELMLAPIFWFLPLMVAVIVGFLRGIRDEEIDPSDPAALDAYFENRKWANQPRWLKRTLLVLVVLYLYALLRPELEVPHTSVAAMHQATVVIDNAALYAKLDAALADGRVMESEYDSFVNLSFTLQMEEFKLENEID